MLEKIVKRCQKLDAAGMPEHISAPCNAPEASLPLLVACALGLVSDSGAAEVSADDQRCRVQAACASCMCIVC